MNRTMEEEWAKGRPHVHICMNMGGPLSRGSRYSRGAIFNGVVKGSREICIKYLHSFDNNEQISD